MNETVTESKPVPPRQSVAESLAPWILKVPHGIPLLIIVFLAALIGAVYVCWWIWLRQVFAWVNEAGWRWTFGWLALFFLAFAPVYVVMGFWPVILASLNSVGNRDEKRELDDLDILEREIRGSDDPIDYARYSRKALRAYYLMGQNQVSLSFYVGVAAMIFGFLFLVAGLIVQVLDTTAFPYLRKNIDVSPIAVGGAVIIEFIAATFLWIYRTAIVQLNLYYRRQILIHSALLSVAIAKDLQGEECGAAMQSIISTLITLGPEMTLPELPQKQNKVKTPLVRRKKTDGSNTNSGEG